MRVSRRRAIGLAAAGVAGAGLIGAGFGVREAAMKATARNRRAEAAYPPLGELVDIGGQRIHLFEKGPKSAPAVVLIHGASGNLRDFAFSFMDRIADRYRVIAVDRPGFGHSDRNPSGAKPSGVKPSDALPSGADRSTGDSGGAHRPDVQAAKMRAAVRAIGVEREIVVGHSLGSASALCWALDAPASTQGVVVLGGVSHPWPGTAGLIYDFGSVPGVDRLVGAAVNAMVSEERAKNGIEGIFEPQKAPEGYADYVGVALALRADTFRYNNLDIGLLKPVIRERAREYPAMRTPIEILHGARDTIVKPEIHSIPLSERAPNARLTLLDGVGHMPHHAAPEACIAAIDRLADLAR